MGVGRDRNEKRKKVKKGGNVASHLTQMRRRWGVGKNRPKDALKSMQATNKKSAKNTHMILMFHVSLLCQTSI